MKQFDVAVVGAGVHGASVAFHLAERGVRTVVFEKGVPAGGPTGRSSAVCRAYYTNDFLARVAREAIEMFTEFESVTAGRDAGFRRTGALFLHPPEDGPVLEEATRHLNAIGTKTELIHVDDLTVRFPQFDLDGIGFGAWEEDAGYADPAGTTDGLVRRAVELGAELRANSAVVGLSTVAGGGVEVRTADGERVVADRLLLAAGPWTGPLAGRLGVQLPLTVERHIVATFGWGAAEAIPFVFADIPAGYYVKPEGAEQFFVGPLHEEPPCDPDDFEEEIRPSESAELAGRVVARVPSLVDSEVRSGWASLYDVSPDWQPVIGEVAEGVFVDCGTSGHGFKLAPALGRHIADLLTGAEVDPGLAQFHPRRFEDGAAIKGGYGEARILG